MGWSCPRAVASLLGAALIASAAPATAFAVGDGGGLASDSSRAALALEARERAEREAARRLMVALDPTATAAERVDLPLEGLEVEVVGDDLLLVDVDSATSAGDLRRRLDAHPAVALVESDAVVWPTQLPTLTDDPLVVEQWGLRNDGQLINRVAGTAGMDVRAEDAWRRGRGRARVVVAVVDSGLDVDHPDLAGALWTNPDEDVDGRDTDGNGYVDDVHGYDFRRGTGQLTDADGHGTAVIGILAARADNETGIAGMAPDVSVMVLRAFAGDGSEGIASRLSVLVEALTYAVDHGADIINASWVTETDSVILRDLIRRSGVPVVAAAGNDGFDPSRRPGDPVMYPAGYQLPNVVAVTAVDNRGQLPRFANTDRERVHLAAPGVGILSTVPGGGFSSSPGEVGTSFAVPFVSASLALGKSAAPYATTDELIDAVLRTTRVLPSLEDRTVTGGMLDAGAAVEAARRPACRPDRVARSAFTDVPRRSVHASNIDCLSALGVTEGAAASRPVYRPQGTVTRGQMARFLARVIDRAVGLPDAPPDAFVDDDGHEHERAIDALAALGIAKVGPEARFDPNDSVTREQTASFVVRTHQFLTGEQVTPSRRWFSDTTHSVHRDNIDLARDLGTVRGVERDRFDPGGLTRRDHMASFVARLLDALARDGIRLQVG